MSQRFKAGDRVVCTKISAQHYYIIPTIGQVYEVTKVEVSPYFATIQDGQPITFLEDDFELLSAADSFKPKVSVEQLDLYKPIIKPLHYTCPYEEYNDKYNLEEP